MYTVILLAATLGQVSASDGPPRQWLPGVMNGRVVQLWGWRDVSGGVRYVPMENHHLFPQYKPPSGPVDEQKAKTARPAGNTGIVLESNGTLNSGLNLQGARPTIGLDTEDRELLKRLSGDSGSPCPVPDRQPVIDPNPTPLAPYREYLVPGAILVAAMLIICFGMARRQP